MAFKQLTRVHVFLRIYVGTTYIKKMKFSRVLTLSAIYKAYI